MSCLLTLFNAKHCVVNTLLDLNIFQCIAFPSLYRFELLEHSAKQVSDRRGRRKQRETGPQPTISFPEPAILGKERVALG